MQRIFFLLIVLFFLAIVFGCGGANGISGDSPTEAYKRLFAAVKSKDTEAIKKQLTKKTIDLGKMSMTRYKKTEQEAYENGFTSTTFSESLPNIRDERVKDTMGSVEVWNSKESRWEDLPFIIEDGTWKLAMGELFAGSFKSPGKGRDQLEKEAANAISNSEKAPSLYPNSNNITASNAPPPAPNSNAKPK
ncbi:MAG: hypothetical protein ABJB40_04905 [Acidobacteriota bacterium]